MLNLDLDLTCRGINFHRRADFAACYRNRGNDNITYPFRWERRGGKKKTATFKLAIYKLYCTVNYYYY